MFRTIISYKQNESLVFKVEKENIPNDIYNICDYVGDSRVDGLNLYMIKKNKNNKNFFDYYNSIYYGKNKTEFLRTVKIKKLLGIDYFQNFTDVEKTLLSFFNI